MILSLVKWFHSMRLSTVTWCLVAMPHKVSPFLILYFLYSSSWIGVPELVEGPSFVTAMFSCSVGASTGSAALTYSVGASTGSATLTCSVGASTGSAALTCSVGASTGSATSV